MRAGRAPPAGSGAERGHGERGGRWAALRGSLLFLLPPPPPRGLARRAGQRRETPEVARGCAGRAGGLAGRESFVCGARACVGRDGAALGLAVGRGARSSLQPARAARVFSKPRGSCGDPFSHSHEGAVRTGHRFPNVCISFFHAG